MSLQFLPLITHSSGNSSLVKRMTLIMMRWYALPTLSITVKCDEAMIVWIKDVLQDPTGADYNDKT